MSSRNRLYVLASCEVRLYRLVSEGAVWLWKGSVVSLRAFLYSVVAFCLSAYEVPVCHFASRLLDAFCSSLFVVVEGAALS
jgi:hypothetical protein